MTSESVIGKTCPYCQTPLKHTDPVVVCGACRMPHHAECWQENGRCTTFGCAGVPTGGAGHLPHPPPAPPGFPYQQGIPGAPLPPPPTGMYQYPPGYAAPPQRATGSANDVAALVLGILSLVTCCAGIVLGPIAIVLATQARNDPRANQGNATAGLVLGIIGSLIGLLFSIGIGSSLGN